MSKTIPLIHKSAAIIQIDVLKHYVKNVWPIVKDAQLPVYLESTPAQFIPFYSFSRLLQAAFEQLPAGDFIDFIQHGGKQYSQQVGLLSSSEKQRTRVELLGDFLPVQSLALKHSAKSTDALDLSFELNLEELSPFTFVSELYAIVVAHHYLTQTHSGVGTPFKYHLVSQEKLGLEQLKISTQTPQFMGQKNTTLFYQPTEKESHKLVCVSWQKQHLTFTEQVSQALEGYIGRQNISLDTFSEIIDIPPRTIQRYLGKDGCTYRKVKESLNMAFAKRVMIERNASIADIAVHLGYADTSQFTRAFKKSEQITPLQWRKKTSKALDKKDA
ncbi:AraC family transcriptional regulator [Vibrio sp. T187]|uniref:helix-turn-helix domain-containing protein n=1 Tax=Vibrio TaxID=662 RepID=UPI0010C9AF67|nr:MULTISPECIES: helix-turn-helix domain-containing protein [Vibrio]MBW3695499.1 AraC family transcriptional regulator [Vibrio sp. T187]